MADIDVVKTGRGSKTWVWVLLAVVALILMWFFMMGGDRTPVGFLFDTGQSVTAV